MSEELNVVSSDIGGIDVSVAAELNEDGNPKVVIKTSGSGTLEVELNGRRAFMVNPADYQRSISMTDNNGEPVELSGLELIGFLERLPIKHIDRPVIVGTADSRGAYGLSVVKASLDFEKGGPVILLETEEVDTE